MIAGYNRVLMSLFESTLALLGIAVVLLQLARSLRVPYPALLALVGGCVAGLPFAPRIQIQPQLALALFVAPAVMDAAFDIPPRELLRNWLPLVSLAVVLVLLTAAAVAVAGVKFAQLPIAAAIALGAIVAPPDAAAASAVLREFDLPRRTMGVLQGESLLNDAVALLVFGIAVSAATAGDPWSHVVPRLSVAVPVGALFGASVGIVAKHIFPRLGETMSYVLMQFLVTYGTWLAADRLGLSPIMAVVALAAVASRDAPARSSARGRVNSNVVWSVVVFVLNVLAFLLMGLQARVILTKLEGPALLHDVKFAAIVLALVIAVRFAWVMTFGWVLRRFHRFFATWVSPGVPVPIVRIGVLVSWCGMRGLVTLATAFALPPDFPGRDLNVLAAFTVVAGTLVAKGFTIRPLIAWLRIAPDRSLDEEVAITRRGMLDAALAELEGVNDEGVEALRAELTAQRDSSDSRSRPVTSHDRARLRAVSAARRFLIERRRQGQIFEDTYHRLEDELDRAELHAAQLESTLLEG